MKTKKEIAQETQDKHWETIQGTDDASLANWSNDTYEKLIHADAALETLRLLSKRLEVERSETRVAHRRQSNNETLTAWHEAVAKSNACQEELKLKRIERNGIQALSELLATEVRTRRERATRHPSSQTEETPIEAEGINVVGGKRRGVKIHSDLTLSKEKTKRLKSEQWEPEGDEAKLLDQEDERCPFCSHVYTVRDGVHSRLNAMGEPMQLRKCQCREMAPPCRNCPKCKGNPDLMAVDADEQLAICREKEACEICSCECPGGGKWIEGDELSREKYRKKATERYKKLTGILQASWGGKNQHIEVEMDKNEVREIPKRLPADIRNQIDAARSLLGEVHDEHEDEDQCGIKNCIACHDH